ncbi:hypothetical protein J2S07_002897 [Robertmurraya andreesenii]|uniref:Uncharacterized protein n=1 Tax=Anoxybacillus andreesenii TaxID=1325932 RepID=A0ABT9V6K4_9BACL|nr:hypothetical protein [Robertmurraya andreesenii]
MKIIKKYRLIFIFLLIILAYILKVSSLLHFSIMIGAVFFWLYVSKHFFKENNFKEFSFKQKVLFYSIMICLSIAVITSVLLVV